MTMVISIRSLWSAAIVLAAVASNAVSQPGGPQQDRGVSSSEKSAVISQGLDSLRRFYFSNAAAARVAKRIREKENSGAYRAITSANELARTLSEDLQAEAKDLHLRVIYSAEPIPPKPAAGAQPSPERLKRMKAFHAHHNFGLKQLSRLAGNIGYMDLTGFADTAVASDALAAAMSFLSNTDALIIDLRNNRGGEPEMQSLLASYFFGEKTLISTFTSDDPSRVQENWTRTVRGPAYLNKPVYILTSARVTFSAAEGFSYIMKVFGKAEVVGEKTGGGSNPSDGYILNRNFAIIIPYATPIVPVTRTNWAGGVIPDVQSTADDALRVAQIAALEKLLKGPADDLTEERTDALEELKRQASVAPGK
jgi:hypothetical protein